MDRTILHCDCNAFYASVECVLNPELKKVPMAVGGDEENIQCAGFTIEVFEYLFGETNGTGENTLTIRNRSDGNWTEAALKKWMTDTFRPGDYLAYDNIKYGYPHYVTIYSVDTDGIWVYEANYGGRCKINFRKFTFKEIYEETDGLWHRTPNNYELSEY